MYLLSILSLLICGLSMFVVKRSYKLALLFLSCICFSSVVMPGIPFGMGPYFAAHCFLISEIRRVKQIIKNVKDTCIPTILFIVFLATVLFFVNSTRSSSLFDFTKMFLESFTAAYLGLVYGYICVTSENSLNPLLKVSFYGVLVLTFFGVVNLLLHRGVFIDAVVDAKQALTITGQVFADSDRFRVQAMFQNPFDYGFICIVVALLHFWGYIRNLNTIRNLYIMFVCCIFGVIFCGCRTLYLCAFVAVAFFVGYAYQLSRTIKYVIVGIVGVVALYLFVPFVAEKIDSMLSIFDTNATVNGSSLEMRLEQLNGVLYYMNGHEWFGRGAGFFSKDLGYGEGGVATLVDDRLYGLESISLGIMLEKGFVGLLLYYSVIFILARYIFLKRNINNITAAISLSVLATYFAFANMTGELLSIFPTCLMLGMGIKMLHIDKQAQNNAEAQNEQRTIEKSQIIGSNHASNSYHNS